MIVWIGKIENTPIGPLWVAVSERGLAAVEFQDSQERFTHLVKSLGFKQVIFGPNKVAEASRQIFEYLNGERKAFDLQIDWDVMTPFQEKALRATYAIPYGQMTTYQEIARKVGKPKAARAVGRAEATNPMPLVIPCHRVVGTDGKLHGYGAPGGLETKTWLLQLEKRVCQKDGGL